MKVTAWSKVESAFQAEQSATVQSARRCGAAAQSVQRWLSVLGLFFLVTLGAAVARGAVVQEFYLPMPESQVYTVFNKQAPFDPTNVNMTAFFSIVITTSGTMVTYDQWEDGYEDDINTPLTASTQIWGDGDDGNGICPGFSNDPFGIPVGTVISLSNEVPVPRDFGLDPYLYDGGDRIGATKAITISRACWEYYQRSGAQASAVEVLSTLDHGLSYIAPVGTNVLANGMFTFVDLMVMADETNTTVQIDPDGTGTAVTTSIIDRGALGAILVNDISKGAKVTADKPIQVHMITGNQFNGQFETRSFVLRPLELWSSKYIIPVGTVNANYPGVVYLFNTNASLLTVTFRNSVTNGTLTVPGNNGLFPYTLPMNSGTLLESAGGMPFFAICTMDTDPEGISGADFDWGFAPMPFEGLTTVLVCGRAPGADMNNELYTGAENGSPVWIVALSNTTIYVDFDGNGLPETNFVVSALEVTRIFDFVDNDQTGTRVYTTDGTVIAGAWGEDASVALPGPPYIDIGYALVPFPTFSVLKTSTPVLDTAPTNVLNIGDVLLYTFRVNNRGLLPLGNLVVGDFLPSVQLEYLTNSTTLNGLSFQDDTIGVNGRITKFPLDEAGTTISIQHQDVAVFTYLTRIRGIGTIVNSGYAGGDPDDPDTPKSVTTNFAYTLVSVSNASVREGNSGTTDLVFTVTLSAASLADVSVTYNTANGTATAGSDYEATSETLTIPGGLGITNASIVVTVNGDWLIEPDETLFLNFTDCSSNAVLLVRQATGTIINDDSGFTYHVDWTFNPRRDSWYGTLTLSNDFMSAMSLAAPTVLYEVQSNQYHRLRFPTNSYAAAGTNWGSLNMSAAFNAKVPGGFLDPGESVIISTNIELWGRGSVTSPPLVDHVVAANWVIPQISGYASMAAKVTTPTRESTARPGLLMSGQVTRFGTRIGLPGVALSLSNGGGTATTDAKGNYAVGVPYGWVGTITPAMSGGTFTPSNRAFKAKVTANKSRLDFSWKAKK